jgi:NAD(P)H-flavin reductase
MSMPRKIACAVESITDHGGRVYTVSLTPSSPVPSFRPGQFLHLTVDEYDPGSFWPESRVFSIASSPGDRSRIRICYAVKGRYTVKMEQLLRLGGTVWIKLPYGEFVIDAETDAVLLAGGTGISAFTAFLECLQPEGRRRVWLLYGARHPGLWLFRDMIVRQLAQVPRFRGTFFAETSGDRVGASEPDPSLAPFCKTGRLSLDPVWPELAALGNQVYYLSGPPAMLSALTADLKYRGVEPGQIRTDAWE